jgi:uracil-DNA glycosylase family 4
MNSLAPGDARARRNYRRLGERVSKYALFNAKFGEFFRGASVAKRGTAGRGHPESEGLGAIEDEIVGCSRCPRLVAWREQVAVEKVRRFADEVYWGRPVPSFGDRKARLVLVGLAPAAHGANRTGRMFTGDRSGDWLYRALHRAGFANQSASSHRGDGLELADCYITAVAHCAPPDNRPLPDEIASCRPILEREVAALESMRVVGALGGNAFDAAYRVLRERVKRPPTRKPAFGHGAEVEVGDVVLLGSYHPSQQNTFTGRLTPAMWNRVFARARELLT